MSVDKQAAFYNALRLAALAAGATAVYNAVAPITAVVPYVVYALNGNTGPSDPNYGGSYIEDDVYLVSAVASKQRDADVLQGAIGDALHRQQPSGLITIRRENRAPLPAPRPDQERFVAATYYRVKYTRGG